MKGEYPRRDFDAGPQTYNDKRFMDIIFHATGLSTRTDPVVVVDLMSGPGKVAFGLQERAPRNRYIVLDASQGQLDKITQPGVEKILADVRDLSSRVEDEFVDLATVRYGLKDIPHGQQPGVLLGINKMLKPGGVLVIADMVSPEGAREWNIMQHSRKQQLSGRNIQEEGECYIPTEIEWLKMLEDAGFEPKVSDRYKSLVTTTDWVKGKQITDEQRVQMDALILSASDAIKKQFNIREEGGEVKIDYPVVIIRAVKKVAWSGLPTAGDLYVAS